MDSENINKKQNIKNRLTDIFLHKRYYYETKEMATRSSIYVMPNKSYYIRTSKKNRRLILFLSHTFAAALLITEYKAILDSFERFSFGTIFYTFFTIIAPLFAWIYFFDNRHKLAISSEGVMTSQGDLYQWSLINKTYIKEVIEKTNKYFLILELSYSQTEKIELDISFMDTKPEDIALIVETLKSKALPIT